MGEPIRILCVFSTLDRGGAESMCMNLYRHIDREKVQFDFVKHTPDKGAFEEEILSLGGRVYAAPRYRIYNHLTYAGWWRRFLRTHPEYAIIHGHYFTISPVFFSAARKMGRLTIGHSHASFSIEPGIAGKIKYRLEMKTEKYSDTCFACSRDAGAWLFPHKPFTVLNNAVDAAQYAYDPEIRRQVRAELRLGEALVVGAVGTIKDVKNPFGVLEIFRAVRERVPQAKLLWVGDGPMRTEVEERVRRDGLTDSVIFTGVRSDVERLLQAMDAFILPSFSEGLPVVAVEAQAAGLPCFLSSAITDEVAITDRCVFLPLDSPEKWADAICGALPERKDTTQQIIDAGYDIHTTAKWLEEFYLSLDKGR